MQILQILHNRERGGIIRIASMVEGLSSHGIRVETAYLFPRTGLNSAAKIFCVLAMAHRILRGGCDAIIAYQATASILVGAIGRWRNCPLRIVHQTCTPGAMAFAVRLMDKLVGTLGLYTVNIANSTATLVEFDRYPASYRRAMIVIEHGLDPPCPSYWPNETRVRFKLPATKPILLNVGRLVAQKINVSSLRRLTQCPMLTW